MPDLDIDFVRAQFPAFAEPSLAGQAFFENAGGSYACRQVIDREILVSESEILDAARRVYRDDGELIEGAAGVAVAAFLKTAADYVDKTVAIVICGGNVDPALEALIREN